MKLKIGLVQTSISQEIEKNVNVINDYISKSENVDLLVFPEGMISGYYPQDPDFLNKIEKQNLQSTIDSIQNTVAMKGIPALIPTAMKENDKWFNATLWFNKKGEIEHIYRKCNLSNLDRNHFTAGDTLEIFDFNGVKTSIQMCREIKYPEQWLYLKLQEAQIIFHPNNNQDGDDFWENIYRTRAYENQIYIVSVNPSHEKQKLFSYVVSPKGNIILKTESKQQLYYVSIDLDEIKNDIILQRRKDLLDIVYKGR